MHEKKYQICQVKKGLNNAGSKANNDCTVIASKLGFQNVNIIFFSEKDGILAKIERQIGYVISWIKAFFKVDGVLLLQHPCHYKQIGRRCSLRLLKKLKKIKVISVVHDVEELRKMLYNRMYQKEYKNMMQIADVLIVHNKKMNQFFLEKGVPEEKIVVLEIFDYLLEKNIIREKKFGRCIVIAGNLDSKKSPYIGNLSKLKQIEVKLYGPNFDARLGETENIQYCGSMKPDELPAYLNEGFGLVWDGNCIDTCSGETGEYLRYNNPHKLSLYLASGLPVVIWREAAEADFVKKYGVGICVSSLKEAEQKIMDMDEITYNTLVSNVAKISDKLREGYFMKNAIEKAEKIIYKTP